MKVSKSVVFLYFVFIFMEINAFGQPVMHKYFPKTAPSIIMYQDAGISNSYFRWYYQANNWPDLIQLRGSVIPFYQQDYYINEIQKSVVSYALMQKSIHKYTFNPYFVQMGYHKSSLVSPLALPVIYIKPVVHKIAFDATHSLPQVSTINSIIFGNAVLNTTLQTFKPDYTYLQLLRGVYYDTPQMVDVHFDVLPDPPKLRQGLSAERRASRESLAELFTRDSPAIPVKLDKVKLIKRPWKFSGSENIQLSQAYLKNWAKGGQNSLALLSDLRIKAVYEEGKTQWENSGIHKLGIISSQGSLSRVNDDLIDLTSKYGISASKEWFYSFLFNMKTQFFNGYARTDALKENPISGFMAPGYFTLAAGMDLKKGKNFTLMLSPVTSKLTVVLDTAKIDPRRYNIPEGKRSAFLTGGSLINNFTWQINKEIKLTSAANIFYDYFEKKNKVQADWDMILDMRINVFLSTRIVTNFRYYENESLKLQIRENMSIAFRYNF